MLYSSSNHIVTIYRLLSNMEECFLVHSNIQVLLYIVIYSSLKNRLVNLIGQLVMNTNDIS